MRSKHMTHTQSGINFGQLMIYAYVPFVAHHLSFSHSLTRSFVRLFASFKIHRIKFFVFVSHIQTFLTATNEHTCKSEQERQKDREQRSRTHHRLDFRWAFIKQLMLIKSICRMVTIAAIDIQSKNNAANALYVQYILYIYVCVYHL